GAIGAAPDSEAGGTDDDRRVRPASVRSQESVGRSDSRTVGREGVVRGNHGPTVRRSDCPTNDVSIPAATVTPVPSGTYHGHARPGSRCQGKPGITLPSTTGVIATTLTMIAVITSICRARGHRPPSTANRRDHCNHRERGRDDAGGDPKSTRLN